MKRVATSAIPIVIVSGVLLFYFLFDARNTAWLPQCPFHLFTGFFCPGCGSQRSLSSILHGEFLQAMRFNILLVASLPFLLYSAAIMVINKTTGHNIIQKIFYSTFFVKVVLIVIIAFWILRNIPVFPFTFLAPHEL